MGAPLESAHQCIRGDHEDPRPGSKLDKSFRLELPVGRENDSGIGTQFAGQVASARQALAVPELTKMQPAEHALSKDLGDLGAAPGHERWL